MNPYQLFATDKQAETEHGIILDYGTFRMRILRAGGSNRKFIETLNRRLKPYRRQIENDTMDSDMAQRIMAEVYADTVIIGWDEVPDAEGSPLEYCRNNVIKLLTDLPELFRDIQEQAGKAALFRAAEREDEQKNLQSGSAGNLSTQTS